MSLHVETFKTELTARYGEIQHGGRWYIGEHLHQSKASRMSGLLLTTQQEIRHTSSRQTTAR